MPLGKLFGQLYVDQSGQGIKQLPLPNVPHSHPASSSAVDDRLI